MSRLPALAATLALATLGLTLSATLPGCLDARSAACKDNSDCQKQTDGGAPVCYSLRCVECHYDVDCPVGKACTTGNYCEGLGTPTGEDAGAEKWEASNWDDCARDCKDSSCVKSCDARFPKTANDGKKKPATKK